MPSDRDKNWYIITDGRAAILTLVERDMHAMPRPAPPDGAL
jgi:hypothetical protein